MLQTTAQAVANYFADGPPISNGIYLMVEPDEVPELPLLIIYVSSLFPSCPCSCGRGCCMSHFIIPMLVAVQHGARQAAAADHRNEGGWAAPIPRGSG